MKSITKFNLYITREGVNPNFSFSVKELGRALEITPNTAYKLVKGAIDTGILIPKGNTRYSLNPKYRQGIILDWCSKQMKAYGDDDK